jgi:uncharacterized membrane protein
MKLIKSNLRTLAILILGFIGFLDATYLTILHYQDVIPPCTVTKGCETVLNSSYATVFGIPIALLGALFYVTVIGLSLLLLTNYKKIFLNLLVLLSISGAIVSTYLLYIQFGVLKNFCQYCLVSELVSFLIFLGAILIWSINSSKK